MSRFWFRIFIILALIGYLGYGIFLISRQQREMFVPSKFMTDRNEASDLLKQMLDMPDIDLTVLATYDKGKDWRPAVDALSKAREQNADVLVLIKVLAAKTADLLNENTKINDDYLRKRGEAALGALKSGNDNLLRYFELHADIIEVAWLYYLVLSGGGFALTPDFTGDLKDAESFMESAKKNYAKFNSEIAAFDKAAGIK